MPRANVVLVADRDVERRAELIKVLERFDPSAEILETGSGEVLIKLAVSRRPSLAFVGLMLDGLSGPEAIAMARRAGADLPCIVLLAARVFPQWQELAVNLGAYEVLKTPIDRAHIESLLHTNVRRRKATQVLLASSSEARRTTIGRVLMRSGFNLTVDETDSEPQALKLLESGRYALAFIDAKLDGVDGTELADKVQPLDLATRLILLTIGDPMPVAEAARHLGVDFILKMPFYARDIDLAVHHALGLRRPYLLNAITAAPAPTALLRVVDVALPRLSASGNRHGAMVTRGSPASLQPAQLP